MLCNVRLFLWQRKWLCVKFFICIIIFVILDLMATQRAKWTSRYEKGLVDVLLEHRASHLRVQNRWSFEGWNQIVKDFNSLYPEARFTKFQIQDKETQLKIQYKEIKSICKRIGVNWNKDTSMINTTAEIWDEIAQVRSSTTHLFLEMAMLIKSDFSNIVFTGGCKVEEI